jgi:hypothetical protein
MLSYIVDMVKDLKDLADAASLPFIKFYDFHLISFDNTAANTGDKNGLGVLFDKLRYVYLVSLF